MGHGSGLSLSQVCGQVGTRTNAEYCQFRLQTIVSFVSNSIFWDGIIEFKRWDWCPLNSLHPSGICQSPLVSDWLQRIALRHLTWVNCGRIRWHRLWWRTNGSGQQAILQQIHASRGAQASYLTGFKLDAGSNTWCGEAHIAERIRVGYTENCE